MEKINHPAKLICKSCGLLMFKGVHRALPLIGGGSILLALSVLTLLVPVIGVIGILGILVSLVIYGFAFVSLFKKAEYEARYFCSHCKARTHVIRQSPESVVLRHYKR